MAHLLNSLPSKAPGWVVNYDHRAFIKLTIKLKMRKLAANVFCRIYFKLSSSFLKASTETQL